MENKSNSFLKALWKFFARQDGQDLVEYALLVALVSLGATTAMKSVATDISSAFTHDATLFNGDI